MYSILRRIFLLLTPKCMSTYLALLPWKGACYYCTFCTNRLDSRFFFPVLLAGVVMQPSFLGLLRTEITARIFWQKSCTVVHSLWCDCTQPMVWLYKSCSKKSPMTPNFTTGRRPNSRNYSLKEVWFLDRSEAFFSWQCDNNHALCLFAEAQMYFRVDLQSGYQGKYRLGWFRLSDRIGLDKFSTWSTCTKSVVRKLTWGYYYGYVLNLRRENNQRLKTRTFLKWVCAWRPSTTGSPCCQCCRRVPIIPFVTVSTLVGLKCSKTWTNL